jgi:hypothetical protein
MCQLASTFVLDQALSRTYPATTRYLATLERYDESPDQQRSGMQNY